MKMELIYFFLQSSKKNLIWWKDNFKVDLSLLTPNIKIFIVHQVFVVVGNRLA